MTTFPALKRTFDRIGKFSNDRRNRSTVVEHLTQNPNIKSSNPATGSDERKSKTLAHILFF